MTRSWLGPILIVNLATAASAQSGITNLAASLVGNGGGIGEPGQIDAHFDRGLFTVSYSVTNAANGFTTNYANSIPLSFAGIAGNGTGTDIVLLFAGNANDGVHFHDTNSHLRNDGRDGTASVDWGIGAFHGATGTLTYNFKCTSLCFQGQGTPVAGIFGFTMSASGTLDLQTARAQDITPQASTNPPAPNSIKTFITKPAGGSAPSIRRASAVSAAATGSSGGGESLSFAVPWQPVKSTFSATGACPTLPNGCWLAIPTASGTISPFTDASIEVDLNYGELGTGVYPANFTFTLTPGQGGGAPATQSLPFTLIVTDGSPQLQISERGIQFQTVAGENQGPPAHTISLSSTGAAIPYTATASTAAGGNWLTVTPASGSAFLSTAPAIVAIAANPAGLAPGDYFGHVDIHAPGAFEPEQTVVVELAVTAAAAAAPLLSTTGVVFVARQFTNPAQQSLTVSTLSNEQIAVSGKASADNSGTWLSASASSTILQSGQPVTETLFVNTQGLSPGVYTGTFYETVTATAKDVPAKVLLILTPPSGASCTPTQLLPAMTNLGANFEFRAGLPISLQAEIVDDCGSPLNTGAVQASFSTGDLAVAMTPLGNGIWAGTWEPHGIAGGGVSVEIGAQSEAGLLGSISVSGTLDTNTAATVVTPGGIVNAAGLVSGAPLAPGEFISIFGSNLGPSTPVVSPSYPYVTALGGTQVLLGGQRLPLEFVSAGQINALVPYGIAVNGLQELLVEQNGVYSPLEALAVAAANPAVFTQSQSGQGAGVIVVVKADGTQFEATASQPASAGDALVIYCSGLGAVSPAVGDGAAAPLSPLSTTVNAVTATVGGQPAQVLFAGLTPGYAGLYQVNAVVPAGVAAGPNVPVILTVAGFPSAPVTVAIQ